MHRMKLAWALAWVLSLSAISAGCAGAKRTPDGGFEYGMSAASPGQLSHIVLANAAAGAMKTDANGNPVSVSVTTSNRKGTTRVNVSSGYGPGLYGSFGAMPAGADPCLARDPIYGYAYGCTSAPAYPPGSIGSLQPPVAASPTEQDIEGRLKALEDSFEHTLQTFNE